MRQSLDNPNSCSNQMIWPSEPGYSHCKRRSPYSTRPFQGSSGRAPRLRVLFTVATVQARITKLKAEHKDVMARLYAYYDQSIEDDAKDHYLQTDDLRYFDDLPKGDEWAEHYTRLEVRKPITPVHRILKHGWDGTF